MPAPAVSETAAAYGVEMTVGCQREPAGAPLAAAGLVAVFFVVVVLPTVISLAGVPYR